MAKQKVAFAGREIDGEELSAEERTLLLKTVYDYIGYGNSWLLDTLKLFETEIIGAAMVAKDKFDAPLKGMMGGGGEVGVQLLRPGHIMRDTTTAETPANTWSFTLTSAGDYWIGSGANNTTTVTISQYLVVLLLGLWWTQGGQPIVEEVQFKIGNTDYSPFVVRQGWQADNPNRIRAVRFHPLLAEARQTVLAQTYSIAAGVQEMQLLGLSFGPARYLLKASYVASDLP